jgi:DNA-binding transcriptional ArsR family regulator
MGKTSPMLDGDLSTVFSALADPTRRAILARLSRGEAPVKALAEPFDLSGPAITKHLRVLERAGLISRSREGQFRPCRLEPRALEPAAEWIEQYRAMWEEQFDRLGEYLKEVVAQSVASPDAGASRAGPDAADPAPSLVLRDEESVVRRRGGPKRRA